MIEEKGRILNNRIRSWGLILWIVDMANVQISRILKEVRQSHLMYANDRDLWRCIYKMAEY